MVDLVPGRPGSKEQAAHPHTAKLRPTQNNAAPNSHSTTLHKNKCAAIRTRPIASMAKNKCVLGLAVDNRTRHLEVGRSIVAEKVHDEQFAALRPAFDTSPKMTQRQLRS